MQIKIRKQCFNGSNKRSTLYENKNKTKKSIRHKSIKSEREVSEKCGEWSGVYVGILKKRKEK